MSSLIKYLVFYLLFTSINALNAQDSYYSQFLATPMNLNPALAGIIDGTFRINTVYRDQWTNIVRDPINSFSIGADLKFKTNFGRLSGNKDLIGAGLVFNSDRVSSFDLNTTSVSIIGSFHKSLSAKKAQFLSVGLQYSLIQRNVNYEDLTFQDQFNTLNAFSLPTKESLPANNFGFHDFSVGLNYFDELADSKLTLGVAYWHFNSSNISFYREKSTILTSLEVENNLIPKYSIYGNLETKITESFTMHPRALLLVQNPFLSANIGIDLEFKFTEQLGNSIHFGSWIRATNQLESFGMESIILMIGLERKNLTIGFSYDQNISKLVNNNLNLNAFELSISYIGEHDNSFDSCPKF